MNPHFKWLLESPTEEPVVLNEWDGLPNVVLAPTPSGVLLSWIFEDDDVKMLGIFVNLTSGEAQAVAEGTGGLLEPIRATLHNRLAAVWSRTYTAGNDEAAMFTSEFVIDAQPTDEPQFAALLWAAAEAAGDRQQHEVAEAVTAYDELFSYVRFA